MLPSGTLTSGAGGWGGFSHITHWIYYVILSKTLASLSFSGNCCRCVNAGIFESSVRTVLTQHVWMNSGHQCCQSSGALARNEAAREMQSVNCNKGKVLISQDTLMSLSQPARCWGFIVMVCAGEHSPSLVTWFPAGRVPSQQREDVIKCEQLIDYQLIVIQNWIRQINLVAMNWKLI